MSETVDNPDLIIILEAIEQKQNLQFEQVKTCWLIKLNKDGDFSTFANIPDHTHCLFTSKGHFVAGKAFVSAF